MPPIPTRRFDEEAPKIAKVARNVRAPLQLSFDELRPGDIHGHDIVQPLEYGYVARCRCGWHSRELPEKRSAVYELRSHLGRTPQGSVLLRTLRKYGRSGSGA